MRYILASLLFCSYCSMAQNLLPNGSFEDENTCSEFNERCSPSAWINFSINLPVLINSYSMDGQPLEGTHFIKIIAGNSTLKMCRTFTSSKLLCGLRKGHKYIIDLSFRASFSDVDSLGILFSANNFLFEDRPLNEIVPDFWIKGINFHEGEINTKWVKRTIIFSATGEECYFTLGFFKKSDFDFGKVVFGDRELYIYFDKISIVPFDKNEHLCSEVDSVRLQLYQQHERHSMQAKRRQIFIKHPPTDRKLAKTSITSIDTMELSSIGFISGRSELSKQNLLLLDSFISTIQIKTIDSIVIEGHTDSVGNYNSNDRLSGERSNAVSRYLTGILKIHPDKVFTRAYADSRPISTNATQEGRQKNRRVKIYAYLKDNN